MNMYTFPFYTIQLSSSTLLLHLIDRGQPITFQGGMGDFQNTPAYVLVSYLDLLDCIRFLNSKF